MGPLRIRSPINERIRPIRPPVKRLTPDNRASIATPLNGVLAGLGLGLIHDAGSGGAATAAATLARVEDWPAAAALARRHEVSALFRQGLRTRPDLLAASGIASTLEAEIARTMKRGLRQLGALKEVTDHLADAGIPCLVLKGLPLSQRVYGHPLLKASRDIDLLVPPHRFVDAERMLRDQGLGRAVPGFRETPARIRWYDRFEAHNVLVGLGVSLDLHRRLFPNPHYFDESFDRLYANSATVRIGTVTFRVLDEADELLYLACHGARHYWASLRWLCDVAAMLASTDPDRLGRVARSAERAGLETVFSSTLWLYRKAFHVGAAHGTPAAGNGMRTAFVAHMARRAWANLPTGLRGRRVDWTRKRLVGLLLRSNARYVLHELASVWIGFRDWDRLRLPDWLFFLYFPLRPLLWLTRSRRRDDRRAPSGEPEPGGDPDPGGEGRGVVERKAGTGTSSEAAPGTDGTAPDTMSA